MPHDADPAETFLMDILEDDSSSAAEYHGQVELGDVDQFLSP